MTPKVGDTTPWLCRLPHGWRAGRLDHVAEIRFSNVDKKSADGEVPVRLCNYVDVYANDRIQGDMPFMEATADESEIRRFAIRRGDVLATKDSETPDDIAIPALVAEDYSGVLCGYHLAMIRPRSKDCDSGFLFWLHAAKTIRAQYEAQAAGVTRFGLPQYAFRSLRIPIPKYEAQRRIADFLDGACHTIDNAISAKLRQREALVAARRAEITRAVLLGPNPQAWSESRSDWRSRVPRGWDEVQVKRRCQLVRGRFTHRPRNDPALYGGDFPFVQTGDVAGARRYIREYSQTLNEAGLEVSRLFPRGTLVMTIAANVGDVAILDFDACFPDSLIGLIPDHKTDLTFLYFTMVAMKAALVRAAVLTTQLNLNYVRVGGMHAAFPSLPEQRRIVAELDARLAGMDAVVESVDMQVERLIQARAALIHECVTGKRLVTDEDLNRVRQHAQQTPT